MPILTDPDAAAFRAQVRQPAPETMLRETMQTVDGKLNTCRLTAPDEYLQSVTQMHIHSPSGHQYFGSMSRCGITPPGYPERATYCKSELFYQFDAAKEIYVYEAGYFWESSAWRAFFREHRKTLAEAEKG